MFKMYLVVLISTIVNNNVEKQNPDATVYTYVQFFRCAHSQPQIS